MAKVHLSHIASPAMDLSKDRNPIQATPTEKSPRTQGGMIPHPLPPVNKVRKTLADLTKIGNFKVAGHQAISQVELSSGIVRKVDMTVQYLLSLSSTERATAAGSIFSPLTMCLMVIDLKGLG